MLDIIPIFHQYCTYHNKLLIKIYKHFRNELTETIIKKILDTFNDLIKMLMKYYHIVTYEQEYLFSHQINEKLTIVLDFHINIFYAFNIAKK